MKDGRQRMVNAALADLLRDKVVAVTAGAGAGIGAPTAAATEPG